MPNIINTAGKVMLVGGKVLKFPSNYSFLGSVSIIDSTAGGLSNNAGIELDKASGRLFVANSGGVSVRVFNLPGLLPPSNISSAQGSFNTPTAIAVDPEGGRIFVTNYGNSTISVLNYTTPTTRIATISQASGSFNQPYGIAVDRLGGRIFVGNSGNGTVSVLDYTTPSTLLSVISGAGGAGVAIDRAGGRIFSCTVTSMRILDYTNPSIILDTVAISDYAFRFVAISKSWDKIFVTNGPTSGSSSVVVYSYTNPTAGKIREIKHASLSRSYGIAVDELTETLYVSNFNGNSLSIFQSDFK